MYNNNILETIGNTPLVRLNRITKEIPALVLAKVETTNPGNSIKDRDGALILNAIKDQFGNMSAGKIRRGFVHHDIMSRDFIGFRGLAFAIQF